MFGYYHAYTQFKFTVANMSVNAIVDQHTPLKICNIFPIVEYMDIGIAFDQATTILKQIDGCYVLHVQKLPLSPLVHLLETLYSNKRARKCVFNTTSTRKIVIIVGDDTFCNFELQLKNEYYAIIKASRHAYVGDDLDIYLNYNNLLNDNGLKTLI